MEKLGVILKCEETYLKILINLNTFSPFAKQDVSKKHNIQRLKTLYA